MFEPGLRSCQIGIINNSLKFVVHCVKKAKNENILYFGNGLRKKNLNKNNF